MKKEEMTVSSVSKDENIKHFGLVTATIDRITKRITLTVRGEGPGGKVQDYGEGGRSMCLGWAISSLKRLTDDGFIIEG